MYLHMEIYTLLCPNLAGFSQLMNLYCMLYAKISIRCIHSRRVLWPVGDAGDKWVNGLDPNAIA